MRYLIPGLLALAVSTPAFAQAFNLDVGINTTYPIPSAAYGAGAGQPGTWNAVLPTAGTTPLVTITGSASSVTIAATSGTAYQSNANPGPMGDDANLMRDVSDPGFGATWTFSGLAAGDYKLYTYAWAPDNPLFKSVVNVAGSSDPAQTIGGNWPAGGQTLGITYALHHVTIVSGGTIAMTITVAGGGSFASLNGFQVVPDVGSFTSFCVPGSGGVMTCQCGNPNGAGVGCANTGSSGASLAASGTPSLAADTVLLTASSMHSGSACIFLQGNALAAGVSTVFGAGIRCTGGSLKRLYTKSISGGVASAPSGADPSVSARSAALGDTITPGSTRYYQTYYRDPNLVNPGGGCPTTATFNITSGQIVVWSQ
jgi:hypothetical protein